ncbi:unnamed protein product [Ilex paraguariensis]
MGATEPVVERENGEAVREERENESNREAEVDFRDVERGPEVGAQEHGVQTHSPGEFHMSRLSFGNSKPASRRRNSEEREEGTRVFSASG